MFSGGDSEEDDQVVDSRVDQNDAPSPSPKDVEQSKTWNPFRLAVLKLGITEPAWTSPLNYNNEAGSYRCANCASVLFESDGKYDSGSGWPSFWRTSAIGRVALKKEWDGRVECTCKSCGGHLGHVFGDGPKKN